MSEVNEYRKFAAELGFSLTRQFLTIAFAGIAFTVGVAHTGGSIEASAAWVIVGTFVASIFFGLLLLMRGVGCIHQDGVFNIYDTVIVILSILQIGTVLFGFAFLCPKLMKEKREPDSSATILNIQIDSGNPSTLPLDGGKITVTFDITVDSENSDAQSNQQ